MISKMRDQKKYIKELFTLLKQPSIAADGKGMQEMAYMIEEKLKELGADTKQLKVDDSYPYVYAELGNGPKTLLIYDHYDVQPCENLSLWDSKPFKPEVRDGKMYARGVADNKGNFLLRVQAIREVIEKHGELPIKIKFLVEGEEEIGSPNLHNLSDKYGHLWKDADICLWETGGVDENDIPEMELGQKGITYLELSCRMGERDLHSGTASLVDSPVWRLIYALSTMRDKDGNVTIGKLQKQIVSPTEAEKEIIKEKEWDGEKLLKGLGRKKFLKGNTQKEEVLTKHYFSPTCNICGIWAGYTKEGGIKTILPHKASAKIDLRLVKRQDSAEVAEIIREHLKEKGFKDVKVKELINEPVSKSDVNSPILNKVIGIIGDSYGKEVELSITSGGSGPGYYVASRFEIPIFFLGAGYPETKAHAPNENVRIKDYFKALDATVSVIEKLGE